VNVSTPAERFDDPSIGVGPDGSTTVVWSRDSGTNYIIQAANRTTIGFGIPVNLSAEGRNGRDPQVGVGPNGSATIVWEHQQSNGTDDMIQAASRESAASAFGTAVTLSTAGRNAKTPQVGVGADGSKVVVWELSNANGVDDIIQAATDFAAPAPDPSPTPTPSNAATGGGSNTPATPTDTTPKITIVSATTSQTKATVRVRVPSAGRVTVRGTRIGKPPGKRVAVGPTMRRSTKAQTVEVRVKLNKRTRARLCRRNVRVKLRVTFVSSTGGTVTEPRTVAFKRIKCKQPAK